MTFGGRSEELVSRCVECDLAEPESLASLGGSAPGVVDGILSIHIPFVAFLGAFDWADLNLDMVVACVWMSNLPESLTIEVAQSWCDNVGWTLQ